MRSSLLVLAAAALVMTPAASSRGQGPAPQSGVFTAEFNNPGVSPAHWVLTLRRDGSGHFHADRGPVEPSKRDFIDVMDEDRDVQLSKDFTAQLFSTAQQHNWFNQKCESHAKVAFQGWKKLSYNGPEGHGSCEFNYSQDKEIQATGESLLGLAETLREGARLELLLQHDRLGLDQEMQYIFDSANDGRLREISAIRDILERLAADDELLERVRKRARSLLAKAGS